MSLDRAGEFSEENTHSALNLLLWSDVTVMATLSLSAVDSLWWQSNVTLSANHFFGLVLSGESCECWLDLDLAHTTTSESEDEMESRLLLNVVIRESSAVFKLLSSEDESLLIGRNTFFILDLSPNHDNKLIKELNEVLT